MAQAALAAFGSLDPQTQGQLIQTVGSTVGNAQKTISIVWIVIIIAIVALIITIIIIIAVSSSKKSKGGSGGGRPGKPSRAGGGQAIRP